MLLAKRRIKCRANRTGNKGNLVHEGLCQTLLLLVLSNDDVLHLAHARQGLHVVDLLVLVLAERADGVSQFSQRRLFPTKI